MQRAAKKEQVKRGADELDFIGTRAKSVPLGAPLVRQKAAELSRRALATDGYLGAESHDQGRELIELYMQHADVTLGHRSFRAFLEAHWPLDVSVAYERMRISRLCTHDQAAKYGYTACLLGLRIMSALELTDFEVFRKRPLKLHAADGPGTVTFPATTRQLRSVLREIAARASAGDASDQGRRLQRYQALIDELVASDPHGAGLKPIAWADARGVYLRVTASGKPQARAAVRLYQKLVRLGG